MKRKYKSLIIFSSFKAGMRHINRFVENHTSKQKAVDTAKLKKISNNH